MSFAFPTQTLHFAPPTPASTRDARDVVAVVDAFGPGGELAKPDGYGLSRGYEPSPVPVEPAE